MKNQQFRYRLIAVLLVALLATACIYGVRTIPLTGSGNSLRDAILRLTGQAASSPEAEADTEAPSTTTFMTESFPEEVPATPSLSDALGQILFPEGTVASSPDPDVTWQRETSPTPAPPLSEALSNYFGSPPPETMDHSSVTP